MSSKLNVTYHLRHKTCSMKTNFNLQFQELITAKSEAECASKFECVKQASRKLSLPDSLSKE